MEEIHDLIPGKLKIIQNSRFFKFGNDSVFLANFSEVKKNEIVVDLGCGSGVIPLLLAFKQQPGRVIGLEIQSPLVELARRNVELNGLGDVVEIIEGDLKRAEEYIRPGTVDLVVSNPPFTPPGTGKITSRREVAIARHEIYANLTDVIKNAARLLRFGGRMTMVHRTWRLAEIICLLKEYRLEPKRMVMIQSRLETRSKGFLIEARKGGNTGMIVEPALIVYEEDSDEYTNRVKEIYGEDIDE